MSTELRQIKTRVTPDLHARWKARLADLRLTDSEAMRLAMSCLMDGKASNVPLRFAAIPGCHDRSRRRQEVRFTGSEIEALDKLAQSCGTSRRNYIVNLIRGHLLREPQLGMAELAVVGESNKQLAAFGRHFNQIARKLNAGEGVEARTIAQALNRASDEIEEHLSQVHRVMRSNLDRWPIAEASDEDD